MPYIKDNKRFHLTNPTKPGELNYLIHVLVLDYLDKKGLNYKHLNDVIGVLECVKSEITRRILIPYEDKKKLQNGDLKIYEQVIQNNGLSETESQYDNEGGGPVS